LAASLACSVVLAFVAFASVFLSRNRDAVRVLYDPDHLFQDGERPAAPLEQQKSEILTRLNQELDQSNHRQQPEEHRLLAQLDRLWRSFKRYISPEEPPQPPAPEGKESQAVSPRRGPAPAPADPFARAAPESTDVVQHVLALASSQEVIRKASDPEASETGKDGTAGAAPQAVSSLVKEPGKQATDRILNRFTALDGVRTRGMAWQIDRYLSLEGTLDATQVGETDPDLRDFGLRSVQALAFLQQEPGAGAVRGWDKIDSGYSRSYGIGVNLRLSPRMQMLFDYSHEYPTDHFIEYRGDWESSLMTDYTKKPQDDPSSVHNFFFGLRYLHHQTTALLPFQTGFFYSTNMATDPLPSDVSMGFSVGGGYQRQDLRLGLSYRLRIWQNPDYALLPLQGSPANDLNTRISNQLLFYLSF
jgi:hypothetical protein